MQRAQDTGLAPVGFDPLLREAARRLDEALDGIVAPRASGQRERCRRLLGRAIEGASRALAEATMSLGASAREADPRELSRHRQVARSARSMLVKAYAAKAEDARQGAGQLSLSAQRAPTRKDCDEGWQRVEAIVLGAEASAHAATTTAAELEQDAPGSALARSATRAAHRAAAAARRARGLVEERNHAYTFHADSAFSFGEGWYLAAAAVLDGVAIQIEPGKDGSAQAEKFLHDAGLGSKLQPYRSRPRAMKHTTEIVARAFRTDPAAARSRLRAAFLGAEPIPERVSAWVEQRLAAAPAEALARKKVLLWVRDGRHHPARNTSYPELMELARRVQREGLVPIVTGDALRDGPVPGGALDMILFWKDPTFRGVDQRRSQLQFFEYLKQRHGLIGQLGVTTAGMDGPALLGLPTLYLTDTANVRMREWVGAVPGYQELVRDGDYLERVGGVLSEWAETAPR